MSRTPGAVAETAVEPLEILARLCHGFSIDKREQELVDHFIRIMRSSYPSCRMVVRIFQGRSLEVKVLATSEPGLQLPAMNLPLRLERAALPRDGQVPICLSQADGIQLEESYRSVLDGSGAGASHLLLSDGALIGLINIEGEPGADSQLPPRALGQALASILCRAICNRRQAKDMRSLRVRLERIIDSANALIFITDAAGQILYFNRALTQFCGLTTEQVVGSKLQQWLTEPDRVTFQRIFQGSLAGERISGLEMAFINGRDQLVRAVFNLASLDDPEDDIDSLIGIGQDSTAIKMLESQVIQAEKLATLGQLAAGVAHELNNPLTSISVYADYLLKKLKKEDRDPAEINMLERILEGSHRIFKCARDLVDYAKPSGEQLTDVSINEVIEQALSFCSHVIEQSSAVIHRELAEERPTLWGIKDQLQQVFTNLITNACHALAEQGGEIFIRTALINGELVMAEIQDNGCGIEAAELTQIFEPFFTTKRPGEGTGLGLSVVKKVVDLHEGTMLVRSRPHEGMMFRITFPPRGRGKG